MSKSNIATAYTGLDLMKFVCAFFVICIHTDPLLQVNQDVAFVLKNIISRVAVPFYFMTAGFLFTKKIMSNEDEEANKSYLMKYINRLLTVYLLWTLIFLPYDMYHLLKVSSNTLITIVVYFKDMIFVSSHWHLWFFSGLILAISVLYYFLKRKKITTLLTISILLYFIGLFGDSYYGLIKPGSLLYPILDIYIKYFFTTRNGLFYGIAFVTLGGYIYINPISLPKLQNIVLIIVWYGLLTVEAFLLRSYDIPKQYAYNMFITLIPLAYYIFIFFLNTNFKISNTLSKNFRAFSMGVYCSHAVFLILVADFFTIYGLEINNSLYFVLVTILTFLLVYVLKNSKIEILRKLVL